MPGEPILSAQNISKSYGSQPVLQDISVTLHEGERLGLIGRNGSGKSTLMRILLGTDTPDSGVLTRRRGLRVSMLQQDCHLDPGFTVAQALEYGCAEVRAHLAEYDAIAERLATDHDNAALGERFAELQRELEMADAWNLSNEVKRVTLALGLADPDRILGTLSGGELRRVDLAATILSKPDVLMLDEPTNHIDLKSVEWMESFLKSYPGSIILVTHDRYFLEEVVTRIVEIEFNRLYSFPGNYEQFLEYKSQIKVIEAKSEESRQGVLRRELEWIRRGPKARATKQKARIQRFEELDAQDGPRTHRDLVFEIPRPPRLGKDILEVDKLCYYYGDKMLFDRFSMIMQKKMRLGIVGPNGCGKTTLLNVLMGKTPPRRGQVLIGGTTEFLYVDQTHDDVDPAKTILDYVSNGATYWEINGLRVHVPAYLQSMLFDMDTVRMPMRNLSGGERNRVYLAKKLLQGGNFLVFDEPTNDLDLPTLRVLEEAIEDFDGCAIIVSHDRYFLNRLCTHVIVFEDASELTYVTGNYDDYLAFKERKREEAATAPLPAPVPVTSAAPAKAASGKLSWKDQQDLVGMEDTIHAAEAEVARIEALVVQPGFYGPDHAHIQQTLAELESARSRAEGLYARWAQLESRRSAR